MGETPEPPTPESPVDDAAEAAVEPASHAEPAVAGKRAVRSKGSWRHRPHPRSRVVFLAVAGALSIVIAAGSFASVQAVHAIDRNFTVLHDYHAGTGPDRCTLRTCLPIHPDPKCFTVVCNYLVLGDDSRYGLSQQQQNEFGRSTQNEASRSDTIMLVHLNIPKHHTTIVSIPRDLHVYIPGHGYDKINAAFSYGPGVLVQTIERLSGMPINHYVAVDFAGFENLVGVIGGVPVCIDKPMIDHLAGLYLKRPGCYNLVGQQALGFVRARHIEGDLIPDFSRIARQQIFFRALLQKLISAGSIIHLNALMHAIKHNVTIDQHLNLYALQDLLNEMDLQGQSGVDFRAIPATPFAQNGIDYVRAIEPETTEIWSRIKNDQPLYQLGKELPLTGMTPANIRVQIYSVGTDTTRATQISEYLSKAGFNVLPIETAPSNLIRSQVRWAPDAHEQRKTVSHYIKGVKFVKGVTFGPGGAIVIVVGPHFPAQVAAQS